jgi:trehalose-phosphatase
MAKLLTERHRSCLESRVTRASSLVFYLDFDGTLAPIASEPGLAQIPSTTSLLLEQLVALEGVLVCVMSGRSLTDLRRRVEIPGLVYVGDHGLEIEGASFRFRHPAAPKCRAALDDMNQRLSGLPLLLPGVEVEPKTLTTTIHYRNAEESALEQLQTIVHSLITSHEADLEVASGPLNYEIRPRLDWNKASAIRWIHERTKIRDAMALVIGDTRTDEEVCSAIDDAVTIHVGAKARTPAEYHVPDHASVEKWLGWLTALWKDRLEGPSRAWAPQIRRPEAALREPSGILNVRLRRASLVRRNASGV